MGDAADREASPEPGEPDIPRPPEADIAVPEPGLDMGPDTAAGIAVLTADLTLLSWNPWAERITGYRLEEVAAHGLLRLFEPVEVMHHMVRTVQADRSSRSEYVYLRRVDSRLVPVVVQGALQGTAAPSEARVVIAFRELAPLQRRLHHDDHLRMLGRLASSLSHEIRNPLNAIFLHVDILEEELRQPTSDSRAQMAESLAEIKTEITRLDDLVQDYLSLVRLSDLRREPADVGALVTGFALEMQEQFEARRITLQVEGLDQLGQLALHRNALRRALFNLVQNAMDAMPQGGQLTLCGERTASYVRLEVRDTGTGIPAEQLPLLFTPFHTTKPEGTGLGLYVVQQIVEAHGGRLAATSTPGVGTSFTLTWALEAADPSRSN